jgi:RNA-splicing ligase RtcB
MPNINTTWQQPEYYPLQEQLSQDHKVLHTQIFKEVTSGHGANRVRRLMVTEIDRTGQERNRRPEFFFSGY